MTEWKTYKIEDICKRVCSGGTPKSTEASYYDGNIPWLNTKEINFNRIHSTERRITELGLDNSSAKWIDKNSVIVAMYGATAAKVAINTIPLTTNQACCNLSINESIADYRFVYYWLSSHYTELSSLANGGAQQNLNAQQIKDFAITLPDLFTQREIADVLWSIDDKIENNRRINDNLEQQAQALYKQWFVDNRKDDWEILELDKVAKISAGGDKPQVCSKQKTKEYRVPIFSNGIDNEGLYGYTNEPRILENSITVSARGTIGFVCLRTEPYVPIVRLISVVPTKENLSAEFLYIWAITQNIIGTGTTQQQLTVPDFRKTNIVIPDTHLLCKFNEVIIPIFSEIKKNKEECETLATFRDTLLPKLMNGEIKI